MLKIENNLDANVSSILAIDIDNSPMIGRVRASTKIKEIKVPRCRVNVSSSKFYVQNNDEE